MKSQTARRGESGTERGSTLYIVAASLVVLLGLAGLAIDLAALYVGRSEAQRAADAAALAGADTFVTSGYSNGAVAASALCPASATSPPSGIAGTAAASEGASNTVGGQTLAASQITATCDFSHNVVGGISGDPLITVSVTASMPTLFMRIFGVTTESVSAKATAEAFSPGTSGCNSCVKPFFLPNCDPVHLTPANPACAANAGAPGGYWIDPATGQAANPGNYSAGSHGEPWKLHTNSGPSQWYEAAFDKVPPNCTFGTMGGAAFEDNVKQCSTVAYACGDQLCAFDGKKVGPNIHSVGCLITYSPTCTGPPPFTSIDTISTQPPFTITAGPGNPYTSSGTITQSASLVTVPLYNPPPGGLPPGGGPVTIVGWMQVFIQDVKHTGTNDDIDVRVLNVSGCGTGGGGGAGGCTAVGGGATFLPVRLVQNP
jgi:Putative Flp pilus-assembly TadE/G-like